MTNIQEWYDHLTDLGLPLPENNSESSSKINKKHRGQNTVPDRVAFSVYKMFFDESQYNAFEIDKLEALSVFISLYKEHMGKDHPELTYEQWEEARENLLVVEEVDFSVHDEVVMMESYFQTKFQDGCNYSVLHYVSGDLRRVRYYDVIYYE